MTKEKLISKVQSIAEYVSGLITGVFLFTPPDTDLLTTLFIIGVSTFFIWGIKDIIKNWIDANFE